MTNTTGTTTPAGWYPVAPGSSQLRWWDGAAWTDHVHDQAAAQVGGALPKAPEGTKTNTIWGWIIALSPLLTLSSLLVVNYSAYMKAAELNAASGGSDPTRYLSQVAASGYFTSMGIGLLLYALTVVLGVLDWRRLRANGVPRPFHWAWTFLAASVVYMIGRSVVVKRRTGHGLAPLWVWIVIYAIVIIVSLTVSISATAAAITNLPTT